MIRHGKWLVSSLWGAYERWNRCDCVDLSAAFAYYTLQSFFPILLISLSVASWFLGKQQGLNEQIIVLAAQVLPPSVVGLVDTTLVKLVNQGFGAGLLGAMFLMVTAGNAYLTLQRGADRLWDDVLPRKEGTPLRIQAFRFIRNRVEAFLLVFLIGLLMVVDQISANIRMIPGAVLEDLKRTSPWIGEALIRLPVLQVGQFILPLIGFSITALLLQALLPSRRVPLKPLIPGALLIGTLLTTLNLAVSRSILSLGSRFQAYGFIGGVLVLTLWVWMVGVIIYYGQCWSVVIASKKLNKRGEPHPLNI
nr:YihY/virulence factor BrkB family protein [Prochlorococcus sp. MIT 1223]